MHCTRFCYYHHNHHQFHYCNNAEVPAYLNFLTTCPNHDFRRLTGTIILRKPEPELAVSYCTRKQVLHWPQNSHKPDTYSCHLHSRIWCKNCQDVIPRRRIESRNHCHTTKSTILGPCYYYTTRPPKSWIYILVHSTYKPKGFASPKSMLTVCGSTWYNCWKYVSQNVQTPSGS